MTAGDPQGWPLTYGWSTTGGTLSGSGTSVTRDRDQCGRG